MYFCDSMWRFWVEANLFSMISFVYICIAIGDPEGRVVIPLTGLTQTHCMPSQVRSFIYVICIYVLVSNTIPFQLMFVSFNSNTTVSLVEQELIILPEHLSSAPLYRGVRIARSFVFFVLFCRSLLVHLSFFFWPLFFLSCDVRLLITPLISSNFSFKRIWILPYDICFCILFVIYISLQYLHIRIYIKPFISMYRILLN